MTGTLNALQVVKDNIGKQTKVVFTRIFNNFLKTTVNGNAKPCILSRDDITPKVVKIVSLGEKPSWILWYNGP